MTFSKESFDAANKQFMENLPNKVMIHGRAFAGKDTVADILCSEFGYVKITFAEPIYWIAHNVFRMKHKNRKLLQAIGQGARKIYPDVWTKIAFHRAEKLIRQGKRVVISDLRQKNEFLEGDKRNYLSIHVDADLEVRKERCKARDGIEPQLELWEAKAETGADEYIDRMFVINNSSSLWFTKCQLVLVLDCAEMIGKGM